MMSGIKIKENLREMIYSFKYDIEIRVIDIIGENIDDIDFKVESYTPGSLYNFDNDPSCTYLTSTFQLSVKETWRRKNIIRKVKQIKYKVCETEFISDVDVKIYESIDDAYFFYNIPPFRLPMIGNIWKYGTANEIFEENSGFYWNLDEFVDDNNSKTDMKIVGFESYNHSVKINSASLKFTTVDFVTQDPPLIVNLDVDNTDYIFTRNQANVGTTPLYYSFSIADVSKKFVADYFVMKYQMGSSPVKKAIIAKLMIMCTEG